MKLLIIGQSVVDRISYKGNDELKPGGIFYSAIALRYLAEQDDEIFLCTSMCKQDEYLFKDVYEKVNTHYVQYVENIPTVKLTIDDDKERDETYSNIIHNLILPMNELNKFDDIFINMITGFDINLKQMEEVRKEFKGLIYFDVHTFSRGVGDDLKRNFHRISAFDKWAKNIDILQVNEEEIQTISDEKNEIDIVREMFSYGIKILIVTKDEDGARAYFIEEGEIKSVFISAIKVKVFNKVGCGDVFGAVFFYNYIKSGDIIDSLRVANIIAGVSTLYSHVDEFKNLKRDVLQRYS
ncbi:MAG: carbohydrate kinase family protein [Bacteroidetes bacterium]|nr:carbohydrate kinase family protein [Bacteroidota bacterium]